MSKFIAYVTQEGEGCDYTIDCAKTLWYLKSNSKQNAIIELKKIIIGQWDSDEEGYDEGYWDEFQLEKVILFEISSEEKVPIEEWYSDAIEFAHQERGKSKERAEKRELQRLKEKYEE